MPSADAIPEWMEIGDSGAGSTEDAADGTRSRRFQVKYLLSKLNSYDEAEARLQKLAPLLRRGHRRGRCSADPVGGGLWIGTVDYANESLVTREGFRFGGWEWETSEKSERITQALADGIDPNGFVVAFSKEATEEGVRPGGMGTPDFKGAIGVDGDTVKGIERPMALFNWSETWTCPARYIVSQRPERVVKEKNAQNEMADLSLSRNPLQNLVAEYTFTTNEKVFRGKPPGCVLLTSVKSSRMNLGSSSASLTFSFSFSPLRENFMVGPVKVRKKDGWDYMDVYYETEAAAKEIVKKAKFVFIHRVFPRTDFRDLGIPDTLPRWWLDEDMPGHEFNAAFGS